MPNIPIRLSLASVFVPRPDPVGRNGPSMWQVHPPAGSRCRIAGKTEAGETTWLAGLRVLQEETGLSPERLWPADAMERFREPERDAITVAPCVEACVMAFVDGTAEPRLDPEHGAACRFSMAGAVGAVSFPRQRRILREIAEGLIDRDPLSGLRIDPP